MDVVEVQLSHGNWTSPTSYVPDMLFKPCIHENTCNAVQAMLYMHIKYAAHSVKQRIAKQVVCHLDNLFSKLPVACTARLLLGG